MERKIMYSKHRDNQDIGNFDYPGTTIY